MRALFIHSRETWFRAVRRALREPPDPPSEESLGECLVVFVSVEEGDGLGEAERLVNDAVSQARRVGVDCILLYPFAHLSSRLADPRRAYGLLVEAERLLRERWTGRLARAPFGWYKSFRIHCVGHPLCELSRSYGGEGGLYRLHGGGLAPLREAEALGEAPRFTSGAWDGESLRVMARFGLHPGITLLGAEVAWGALLHAAGGPPAPASPVRGFSSQGREPLPHTLVRLCLDALECGCSEALYRIPGHGDVLARAGLSLDDAAASLGGLMDGFGGRLSSVSASMRGGLVVDWYTDYDGRVIYYESPSGKAVVVGGHAALRSGSSSVACLGPSHELARALVDHGVAMARSGRTPSLPFWASPVHVAVIPVKEGQLGIAEELARQVSSLGLRVYIDPPTRGLGARVRAAGRLWSLYIAVIGEKEARDGTVNVRRRREGDQVVMSIGEFIEDLERQALSGPSPRRVMMGPPTPQSSL
ncbi:MAG: His/Gly/Thr/Pro-type tRNA ligase C-terminal domain-containing protein [Desulfurococcales archaeon]|nr:His/Gly/Thr/Pro-type tRNA ligase C-terminal domain-containing protein [Desulfurococcales archaeon]